MKKLIKVLVAGCVAAVSFAFAGCASCPGNLKEVKGYCYQHNDCDFKLPVKIESGKTGNPDHLLFASTDSLEKIKSNVEKLDKKGESYCADIYRDKFLFIEERTNGGKVHYYLLTELENRNMGDYHFRTPVYSLLVNGEESSSATNKKLYVPAHLLDIEADSEYEYVFDVTAGNEYKLCCEKYELFNFYRNLDNFTVKETQGGITVNVKEDSEAAANSIFWAAFAIDLKEKEDGVYAVYRDASV